MPISYQHTKTGRVVKVLTPEERAVKADPQFVDRTKRRQRKLISNMDDSTRWERIATPPLIGRGAPKTQVITETPVEVDEPTEPDTPAADPEPKKTTPRRPDKPEAEGQGDGKDDELPEGPKFTRVVKKG